MPFLGLWTQQGNTITPASPSASVDVVQAGAALAFFGRTPVAQQAKVVSPAANVAALKTAFDDLQTKLFNYGVLG